MKVFTVEFYRGKIAEDVAMEHETETAARAYLQTLAAMWRSEGILVSCAERETAPARITGQWFEGEALRIMRQAIAATWDGREFKAIDL